MTLSEANAIYTLVSWCLDRRNGTRLDPGSWPPTDVAAGEAAAYLAARSYRSLNPGVSEVFVRGREQLVREAWTGGKQERLP